MSAARIPLPGLDIDPGRVLLSRSSIGHHDAAAKGQDVMRAVVQDRFGPPDVLQLVDTGVPEVGDGDVLIRVRAAALNPADWHILRGDPLIARLMGVGLTRPKARVAGIDVAGVVETAGANVRQRRATRCSGSRGARSLSTRARRRTG